MIAESARTRSSGEAPQWNLISIIGYLIKIRWSDRNLILYLNRHPPEFVIAPATQQNDGDLIRSVECRNEDRSPIQLPDLNGGQYDHVTRETAA